MAGPGIGAMSRKTSVGDLSLRGGIESEEALTDTFWARTDSPSANNAALNLTGDASVQITFIRLASGTDPGDTILEQLGAGITDPDTQVLINGVAYDFVYEFSGTLPTNNNNGANQVPVLFRGDPVALVSVIDYPAPGDVTRLAFLPESGATETQMNAFGNGAITVQGLDTTPPPTPVCYLAGTMIETPTGPVRVDDLRRGSLVMTGRSR
jgi:hypothetical protein